MSKAAQVCPKAIGNNLDCHWLSTLCSVSVVEVDAVKFICNADCYHSFSSILIKHSVPTLIRAKLIYPHPHISKLVGNIKLPLVLNSLPITGLVILQDLALTHLKTTPLDECVNITIFILSIKNS